MSKLTAEDIRRLALLARLQLTEQEVEEYLVSIPLILSYVEQLQSVDTEGLEPTYQVTGLVNVTRSDEVIDYGYLSKQLLELAPEVENDELKVRRMVG